MKQCEGVQVKAALRLGINRNTLHKKTEEFRLRDAGAAHRPPLGDARAAAGRNAGRAGTRVTPGVSVGIMTAAEGFAPMTVRTRFAPSPTGYLHIGGVRTALFNWLAAKAAGGQFVLRIDDTDLGRNRPEAVVPIIEGFHWLGLTWDEGPTDDGSDSFGPFAPYFQSRRNDTYVAAAKKLIASGPRVPGLPEQGRADAGPRR